MDSRAEEEERALSTLEVYQRIFFTCLFSYVDAVVGNAVSYGTRQFGDNAMIKSCGNCAHQLTYRYRLAYEIASAFSVFVTILLMMKCERIKAIRGLFVLLVPSLVPFYFDTSQWGLIMTFVIFSLLYSSLPIVILTYLNELLPTKCRPLAIGSSTSFGYFSSSCAGFLSLYICHENSFLCFGILHFLVLISVAVTFSVPWKTKGKALKDY